MSENGWPGTPGVPVEAKEHSYHWIEENYGPRCYEWADGCWWLGIDSFDPDSMALSRYLGPVAMPDEIAALRERLATAEAVCSAAKIALAAFDTALTRALAKGGRKPT